MEAMPPEVGFDRGGGGVYFTHLSVHLSVRPQNGLDFSGKFVVSTFLPCLTLKSKKVALTIPINF